VRNISISKVLVFQKSGDLMGGRGSGGRRIGSGRKLKSALERAISGRTGPRGVVVGHPSATAVAPVTTFGPPAELVGNPQDFAALVADLEFLKGASRPGDENPQIAELQARVDTLTIVGQALAVWHELAPHAFEARTLTPATAAAFTMLCRWVVKERVLSASWDCGGADHRGLMQRVLTGLKDFGLAPLGKPMYEAAQPIANPLDRFTKTRA
jgi:hypothetical protein